MNFDSHLHNSAADTKRPPNGLTPEDMAALSHYPSLDQLFHDHDLSALTTMKTKLEQTFQNLERVVLRGSTDEAKRAQTAASTVKIALKFLTELEQMRLGKIDT